MYNLVVTDRRIVFAEVTKEMRKPAAEDAAAKAEEEGKGFFAGAAATAGSWHRIDQKYWQMGPEAVPGGEAWQLLGGAPGYCLHQDTARHVR